MGLSGPLLKAHVSSQVNSIFWPYDKFQKSSILPTRVWHFYVSIDFPVGL